MIVCSESYGEEILMKCFDKCGQALIKLSTTCDLSGAQFGQFILFSKMHNNPKNFCSKYVHIHQTPVFIQCGLYISVLGNWCYILFFLKYMFFKFFHSHLSQPQPILEVWSILDRSSFSTLPTGGWLTHLQPSDQNMNTSTAWHRWQRSGPEVDTDSH